MRTICDMCEGAPAALFCATHKAALCPSCDDKVHLCNRLASRHIRVRLGEPSEVPHCDICENSPAFLFCKTDGSSLCLQCDAIVHDGGKQTHERYVLLKQRVECIEKVGPSEDLSSQYTEQNGITHQTLSFGNINEKLDGYKVSPVTISELHINLDEHNSVKIDLNVIPHRIQGDVTNSSQVQVVFIFSSLMMFAFLLCNPVCGLAQLDGYFQGIHSDFIDIMNCRVVELADPLSCSSSAGRHALC